MKHSVWVAALLAAGVVQADPKVKPPHGAKQLTIDYTWHSFSSDEWHTKIAWNGTTYAAGKRTIDPKLIDALYASLTDLKDEPEELRCISHTDDYPNFKISVDGDEPIKISSESNCHAYVPWNITIAGKQRAQFSGDVYRALQPILAGADDRWKKGGNSPEASTYGGGEMVGLGEFEASTGTSSGDAGKCAHSLETNPQAKLVLGDIKVTELQLGCDLGASKDCSADEAEAAFEWQGLTTQLDIPCTNGVVTLPATASTALTELKTFVMSNPVRALVKLSTRPPRLWNNGSWNAEGDFDGAPMLGWAPKSTTISARAFGQTLPVAFWKELGIDPKPFAKKHDGFFELELVLDFAGKRVK
jgi:hypothetical protein